MHVRHRPRVLRSAGALSVRFLLVVTMIAGALTLNLAVAEPAGADTIVRDGSWIIATSERMHELEVHVTVVMTIGRYGGWSMEVYAHNTSRTRKFVDAGAVVRSPATGFTMDVEISRARIGDDVYDVWVRQGDSNDLLIHGEEVFADPDLSFDLWMDARRL